MNACDGGDAVLGFVERHPGLFTARKLHLHAYHRGNQRKTVGDAMVHLRKQQLRPLLGNDELPIRFILRAAQARILQRLVQCADEKGKEVVGRRFHHVVGSAALERPDRNVGVARSGDVENRVGLPISAIALRKFRPVWFSK